MFTETLSKFSFVKQINIHDKLYMEQGVFTYKHKWILITPQEWLADLEQSVVNVTHLSTISFRTNNLLQIQVIYFTKKQVESDKCIKTLSVPQNY